MRKINLDVRGITTTNWMEEEAEKEGKPFQFAPQELLRSRYLSTSIMLSVNKLDTGEKYL